MKTIKEQLKHLEGLKEIPLQTAKGVYVPLKDLMRGNYVMFKGKVLQFMGYDLNKESTLVLSDDNDNTHYVALFSIRPIKLSLALMYKLGFDFNHVDDLNIVEFMGLDFMYSNSKGLIFNRTPIQYLHQLQNLIYVLTNKSIKI